MICEPKLKALPITECIGTLTIGRVADVNQAFNVYIEDVTTKNRNVYQVTATGAGLLIVDLSEDEFSDSHTYELWATLANLTPEDRTTITIEGKSAEVVQLRFTRVFQDGEQYPLATATLGVE